MLAWLLPVLLAGAAAAKAVADSVAHGSPRLARWFGTWTGDASNPTNAQLESSQVSIMTMSPDQGGHTTMPVFGLKPKSYENYTEFKTRDIVLLASEATSNKCAEAPPNVSLADGHSAACWKLA